MISAANATAASYMEVHASTVILQQDEEGGWQTIEIDGEGTATATFESLALELPTKQSGNHSVNINLKDLTYDGDRYIYAGDGSINAIINGLPVNFNNAKATVSIQRNGYEFKGAMYASAGPGTYIQTSFRGYKIGDDDQPQPTTDEPWPGEPDFPGFTPGPGDLKLPRSTMDWDASPSGTRPPNPMQVAEVISVNDPNLRSKLLQGNRGGWLIVRGNTPFPLSDFEFAGWVKIECPYMKLGQTYNNIRGQVGGDDRIWLYGVEVVGNGENTIFSNVEQLFTDQCLFRDNGHVITDTAIHGGFKGTVMNTEFRNNSHDPFQNWSGSVINVAITSANPTGSAHPDFSQFTYQNGVYWKHVWAGAPGSPVPLMGFKAYSLTNSYFEDVRLYSTWGSMIDIRVMSGSVRVNGNASGTVFKNCVWQTTHSSGPLFFGPINALKALAK